MFKHSHWEKTYKYLGIFVWIVSIIKFDLNLLFLSIILLILSIVSKSFNCHQDEQKYIWTMNQGPSALQKTRFLTNKATGESKKFTWVGGEDGYYIDSNNNKYNYYLQEI